MRKFPKSTSNLKPKGILKLNKQTPKLPKVLPTKQRSLSPFFKRKNYHVQLSPQINLDIDSYFDGLEKVYSKNTQVRRN